MMEILKSILFKIEIIRLQLDPTNQPKYIGPSKFELRLQNKILDLRFGPKQKSWPIGALVKLIESKET